MKKSFKYFAVFGTFVLVSLAGPVAYAALTANSQLTQTINGGIISTDIRNSSNGVVSAPTFAMSAVTTSTSSQGSSTGTFGSTTQRISVDNPGGADNGWTLTLQATTPATAKWTSGANNYSYNGAAAAGRLTVNASGAAITPLVPSGNPGQTGITKGSSAAFSGSTPITIMSAGSTAAKVWNGYMTNVALTQTIPVAQATGAYTLDMTQTVAAI